MKSCVVDQTSHKFRSNIVNRLSIVTNSCDQNVMSKTFLDQRVEIHFQIHKKATSALFIQERRVTFLVPFQKSSRNELTQGFRNLAKVLPFSALESSKFLVLKIY